MIVSSKFLIYNQLFRSSKVVNSLDEDSESAISDDDHITENLPNNDDINYVAADNYEDEDEEENNNQGPSLFEVYMKNKAPQANPDARSNNEEENNLESLFDGDESNDGFGTMANEDNNLLSEL